MGGPFSISVDFASSQGLAEGFASGAIAGAEDLFWNALEAHIEEGLPEGERLLKMIARYRRALVDRDGITIEHLGPKIAEEIKREGDRLNQVLREIISVRPQGGFRFESPAVARARFEASLGPMKQVLEDARELLNPPSLVGQIPGLTPELEKKFLNGESVWEWKPGIYMLVRQGSGTGTLDSKIVDRNLAELYHAWRERMGFPDGTSNGANPDLERLQTFGRGHNLDIRLYQSFFTLKPSQARYIEAILKLLPEEFLRNEYLKGIILRSQRRMGGSTGAAFDNGYVHLYDGLFEGPRMRLLALLLHELGHSPAERYALNLEENRPTSPFIPATPPDESIPPDVRKRMHEAFELVTRAGNLYIVEWPGGEGRYQNVAGSFKETFAEHFLLYVVDGERLRRHIQNIVDPKVKAAYQFVYDEFKNRVFAGKEY